MKKIVYSSLQKIVGDDFVSNRQEELFLYSRDLGSSKPGQVDFLVMPRTVEEIREVIKLACRENIPIVPVGGGLNLSGLTIPRRGGIALDMKRMDAVLKVDENSRYALIEPGVTLGQLITYLKKNHPRFEVLGAGCTAGGNGYREFPFQRFRASFHVWGSIRT